MNIGLNRAQLKKEVRPLLLPWGLSVLAGGLIGIKPALEGSGLADLLVGVAAYGFFGGQALLTSTVFGVELHERTLGLLLTQPFSRSRVWGQKMLLAALALLTALIAEAVLLAGMSGWYGGEEVWEAVRQLLSTPGFVLAGMFLVATLCSCAYWTLVARSTIGGVVFTVAAQFIMTLGTAYLRSRITGRDELFQEPAIVPTLVVGGWIYAAAFLYLGWRKFVRLEVKSIALGKGASSSSGLSPRTWWSGILISRPNSRFLNFIRKEVRLQKPIFQLAAVFVLCWAAALTLQRLQPGHNISYLFDVLTCLYAPITCLLAGCISLGEEKALGLTASQLVLPFSPWLQWLIKLLVCAGIAVILGLGLPLLLLVLTAGLIHPGASTALMPKDDGMVALACISVIMFLLGHWAISLTTNTVRAALLAVSGMVVLPAIAALGVYWGNLWADITASSRPPLALRDAALAAIVLVLGQSVARFRKSEEPAGKLFLYSFTLAGLVLFVSFWATCFG